MERASIFVKGRVQAVGFRWWTRARALELGLVGFAANLDDGRVEISAQGERADVETLIAWLEEFPSTRGRPGRVESVVTRWGTPRAELSGFVER